MINSDLGKHKELTNEFAYCHGLINHNMETERLSVVVPDGISSPRLRGDIVSAIADRLMVGSQFKLPPSFSCKKEGGAYLTFKDGELFARNTTFHAAQLQAWESYCERFVYISIL